MATAARTPEVAPVTHVRRIPLVACGALAGIGVAAAVAMLSSREAPEVWTTSLASRPPPADGSSAAPARPESAPVETDTANGVHIGWFRPSGDVPADRLPALQETFSDAVPVRLAGDMWHWQAGDRVALDIPQTGTTVEWVIERVASTLGENRSFIGRATGQARPYRVVVTVGARNAFAHVGSPHGSYELVGNREFGWLMPSAGMDRHVDYSRPDFFLPGEAIRGRP